LSDPKRTRANADSRASPVMRLPVTVCFKRPLAWTQAGWRRWRYLRNRGISSTG